MPRPQAVSSPVRIRFGEFELDEANAWLLCRGKAVALAPTPFNLLCALARQPGALLTKDALLDTVWGHQFVSDSVLKTAISDLRMALGDNPREPRFIETVSRRGYRFIAVPMSADRAGAPPPSVVAASGTVLPPSPAPVGRADVIARLGRGWDQACRGQRAMVWLAGEPGIGKTTLIEHFVAGLGGGVACARGQCVEHYGAGEPYLPVLEALAELCRHDATLPALLRSVAPTWLLQLPWLAGAEERDALRRELAGIGAERMLREMGELLDRYTEQRPLLLVTEDLHWSDRATIRLIDHVARRRGRSCLMWLASFRVAEVVALDHPLNTLRRELRMHRLCEEVVLDPFSESEVADYVARHSASLARDEAFVHAVHERTNGVPLFVSSILEEVLDRSGDDAAIGARLAAVAVPENLAALIDHQIARLSAAERDLLAAAAVCGVEFRVETLAPVLEQEAAAVALACEELARGHVWLVAPRAGDGAASERPYAFRHALLRQVLYDRTPAALRAQLHRAVGAVLERERGAGAAIAASVLALHFDRGGLPAEALRHYAEAAEAALQHFSPATSLAFTERAAALLPQMPHEAGRDRLEITVATLRGVAAFQALGVGAEAVQAFERARSLLAGEPGHPMRGRLLHGVGYLRILRGEFDHALEVATQAEALSADTQDPLLMLAACAARAEAHHLQGRTRDARAWIGRGLAIAETLDTLGAESFTADPQVSLRGLLAIELVRSGLVGQARAQVEQARRRAHDLRQPMTRLVATWHEALLEVLLGDAERVGALADEMGLLVEEFALEQGRAACQWFRGLSLARAGHPAEGHRMIRDAYLRNSQLGMRAGAGEVLGYAAEALWLAGDGAAAQSQLREAIEIAEGLGERVYMPQLRLLESAIARGLGRGADASASARRAVDEARAQEAPWLELLALVELCQHHDATAGERRALGAILGQLPAMADLDAARRARALVKEAKPD